jgi:hypothetical protein
MLQALFHDFYSSAPRLKPDQFWENTLNKMAAQGNNGPFHGKRISREGPACFAVVGIGFTVHTKAATNTPFPRKSYFSQEFFAKIKIFVSTLLYTPITIPTVRTALYFFPLPKSFFSLCGP